MQPIKNNKNVSLKKNSRFTDSGLVKTCDEFPKIQYFFLHENGNSSQLMFHKEMTLICKKVTLIVEIGLLMDFFILFQFMQVLKTKITTVLCQIKKKHFKQAS